MAKSLVELKERLLRAGIAPRHVRRYVTELEEHVADLTAEEERSGKSGEAARAAALARLGSVDELAQRMIAQRQFRSIAARAPWAVLGLLPVASLGVAYVIEFCMIAVAWNLMWSRTNAHYANELHGMALVWYESIKILYVGMPFLIGWAISVVTARQRLRPTWAIVGWTVLACTAICLPHTTRSGGGWTFWLEIDHPSTVRDMILMIVAPLITFCLLAAPYAVWRWRSARIEA